MSGTARRPRRRPGENRELLLEAGLVEFGLFGFAASTAAIAARAGVPQPHLYANFATKQELFSACCELMAERVVQSGSRELSEELARFLLQASSSVRLLDDPAQRGVLERVRAQLGAEGFARALARGAAAL